MKKSLVILGMLAVGFANAQQNNPYEGKVGINNVEPKATLEIKAYKTDGTSKEGLLIPRLNREAIKAMGTDVTESTLVYVNALGGTQDGTVEYVDTTGFYHYIAGTTNKWVKQSTEPWKVYGTDKPATENIQNIYQKGNVIATPLDIPTHFLDIGETSGEETTVWRTKTNKRGFRTYGEDMALDGTFFAKNFGELVGSHLYLKSRGKDNGGSVGVRAGILLSAGGEDPSTPFTNFYIYKYGGDKTTGREVEGTYFINKNLNGGTLAFLEDRTIQFRTLGKYFTNDEGASMTIHNDGNIQAHKINTFTSTDGTNKIVLANAEGILKTSNKTYNQIFRWDGSGERVYLTKLADGITDRPGNANIFIKDDGKVGLGTNPVLDFAVRNAYTGIESTNDGILLKQSGYNDKYAGISSVGAVIISADSNGSHKHTPTYSGFDGMIFNVSTEEVMRIHKNRYVGIGTNEPVQKLDIAGSIKIASSDDTCDDTKAGTIRFKDDKFQGCTSTGWKDLHN